MKSLQSTFIFFSVLLVVGCSQGNKKEKDEKTEEKYVSGYLYFSPEELALFGIHIMDSAIMYNNNIEGVGSLNITIRDKKYYGEAAKTEQTQLGFYPRYITTLDTVQRTMYRLTGDQSRSLEEAQKWEKFENLVPIVVDQVEGDKRFGETLVFWFTKTPELEKILREQ
jgi:hypothetical protein